MTHMIHIPRDTHTPKTPEPLALRLAGSPRQREFHCLGPTLSINNTGGQQNHPNFYNAMLQGRYNEWLGYIKAPISRKHTAAISSSSRNAYQKAFRPVKAASVIISILRSNSSDQFST